MAGTTVEPSKTTHGEITLDLSAAADRGETRRRPGGRWTGGRTKGGEGWGRGQTPDSDVPNSALAH